MIYIARYLKHMKGPSGTRQSRPRRFARAFPGAQRKPASASTPVTGKSVKTPSTPSFM